MIIRHHTKGDAPSFAVYSDCEKYRYELTREWDTASKRLCFVMLNPSTATETQNDPTIERCERRARRLGFGSVCIANIFAFRATDPRDLRAAEQPVGSDNDAKLLEAAKAADMTICAWGVHGAHLGRGAAVEAILRATGVHLHTLGLSKDGHPRHPLYLPYSAQPQVW